MLEFMNILLMIIPGVNYSSDIDLGDGEHDNSGVSVSLIAMVIHQPPQSNADYLGSDIEAGSVKVHQYSSTDDGHKWDKLLLKIHGL